MRYVKLFFNGLVVALPSIIAAVGIIVNNVRSSARQRKDRKIKYKLDLIEKVYATYSGISNQYISLQTSIPTRLIDIQKEIVNKGAEGEMQRLMAEMTELYEKTAFWATYKAGVLDLENIELDIDTTAKFFFNNLSNFRAFVEVFARTIKLFVVCLYEEGDIDHARQTVVNQLQEVMRDIDKATESQIPISKRLWEKTDDYSKVFETLNEKEKANILNYGNDIMDVFVDAIKKTPVEQLDRFELQVAQRVHELIK